MKLVLVNLGCGGRFHPAWENYDLWPSAPGVHHCDLSQGVPLPANHSDAIFNSALLEHLPPVAARGFLQECHRVLKAGGILRIGVPDLERIARTYLRELERSVAGEPGAPANYDWMMLELIDQMVRSTPGGAMARTIQAGAPNDEFIAERIGHEYTDMKKAFAAARNGTLARLRAMEPAVRRHKVLRRLRQVPGDLRRAIACVFLSAADRAALRDGRFRHSGEVHLWMYDRFSLPRLLGECGFRDAAVVPAGESSIPHWQSFGLDLDAGGRPLKPDLFYVECRK